MEAHSTGGTTAGKAPVPKTCEEHSGGGVAPLGAARKHSPLRAHQDQGRAGGSTVPQWPCLPRSLRFTMVLTTLLSTDGPGAAREDEMLSC